MDDDKSDKNMSCVCSYRREVFWQEEKWEKIDCIDTVEILDKLATDPAV